VMGTKKDLRAENKLLVADNNRCFHQVLTLKRAIREFLEAEHAGEMGNLEKAIERLERLVGQS